MPTANNDTVRSAKSTAELELRKAAALWRRCERRSTRSIVTFVGGVGAAVGIHLFGVLGDGLFAIQIAATVFIIIVSVGSLRHWDAAERASRAWFESALRMYHAVFPADEDQFDTRDGSLSEVASRVCRR